MDRLSARERQRFGQVPPQLVQALDDWEHGEHLSRRRWVVPPIPPAVRDLRDVLARAETVVRAASREALVPEPGVDAAPEVDAEVGTGLTGGLVDREVGRSRERQRDTAQAEAA